MNAIRSALLPSDMPAILLAISDRQASILSPVEDSVQRAENLWARYHATDGTRQIDVIDSDQFVAAASKLPVPSRILLVIACARTARASGAWFGEAADRLAKTLGWPSSDGPDLNQGSTELPWTSPEH